jgi:hypothetical protein
MALSTFSRCAFVASLAVTSTSFPAGSVFAQEPSTFVIAAAPGYGVEDCLAEGGECGHVVADAWCEAHGRGAALQFGQSNNAAGAVKPYFITCGD